MVRLLALVTFLFGGQPVDDVDQADFQFPQDFATVAECEALRTGPIGEAAEAQLREYLLGILNRDVADDVKIETKCE